MLVLIRSFVIFYRMSLSPSNLQIKIKQLSLLQIQTISLAKYSSKCLIPSKFTPLSEHSSDKLLTRLQANNVLCFGDPQNKVLQAFGFMILRTIYGEVLNEDLLNMVKYGLYNDQVDLTTIINGPIEHLDNNEMKKLIVEFIVELYFTNFNTVFDKKIHKHPVIIVLMSLFLRCVLVQLGLEEAEDYSYELPADTVVELLSDYFDLNFRNTHEVYLFNDSNLFLYENQSEEMLLGTFGKSSEGKNKKNLPVQRKMGKESRIMNLQRHVQSHQDIRESSIMNEEDLPTPQFSLENSSPTNSQPNYQQIQDGSAFNFKPHSGYRQSYPQKDSFEGIGHYAMTPCLTNLQDQLQSIHTPMYSEQASGRHGDRDDKNNQNKFAFAAGFNEQYFFDTHEVRDSFISMQSMDRQDEERQVCFCKRTARMAMRLHSNVYSMSLGERSSKSTTQSFQKNPNSSRIKFNPNFQFSKVQDKKYKLASPLNKTCQDISRDASFDDVPDNLSCFSDLSRISVVQSSAKGKDQSMTLSPRQIVEPSTYVFKKPKLKFTYARSP